MCGIIGTLPKTTNHLMKIALQTISHRGPDGEGIWNSSEITLGHRRLSILDLSERGNQPMIYGDLVAVFNGEIYNFLEIKNQLLYKKYHFYSDSDTEVILAAYIEWGHKCWNMFNGMWAIAIWNINSKELILSRDRFGKKPLFYAFENNRFIFASEMKAILPFLNDVRVSTDFEWCKANIMSYEGTDKCLIDKVKRFPSAHYASFVSETNQLKLVQYWNTIDNLVNAPNKYEDQVSMFKELLIDACKIRMRSDVPIGTALSGGLDSSTIAAIMCKINAAQNERILSHGQQAFIASFPGSSLDETLLAKKIVDKLNINGNFINIENFNDPNKLKEYIWLCEDLYITSPVPMIELYKYVKKSGVSVTLDGHGADELLSGYGMSIFESFNDISWHDKQKIYSIIQTYKDLSPPSAGFNFASLGYINYLAFKYGRRASFEIIKLLKKVNLLGYAWTNPRNYQKLTDLDYFNSHLYDMFHHTIMPTLLRNYDRYAMAAGVESRMPFLDYRVVTFLFSIPWQSKIRNGYTKSILRDSIKDMLPHQIVWNKTKIGFNSPILSWMKGSWREFFIDILHSKDFDECTLLNSKVVKKEILYVIESDKATFKDATSAWAKFLPYLWGQSFLKRSYQ